MGSYDTLNETEQSQLWLKHIEFDKRREGPYAVLQAIRHIYMHLHMSNIKTCIGKTYLYIKHTYTYLYIKHTYTSLC